MAHYAFRAKLCKPGFQPRLKSALVLTVLVLLVVALIVLILLIVALILVILVGHSLFLL